MKRRNDGERGNKKLREQAVCELSSSQESSSTQSVKDILQRRIEQKGVQKMKSVFLDRKIILLFRIIVSRGGTTNSTNYVRIELRSCQILVIFVKCGR